MSKTNCINCGAAKEASDMQCPFCGTKYADLTAIDIMAGRDIFIQLRGANGAVRTAKAYIQNTTLEFRPENSVELYADGRKVLRGTTGIRVDGSIDFTLYEAL